MAKEGLAAMFGGKPSDSMGGAAEDMNEGEDAAQDVLDAITDGDAKALNMALKRHYEICEAGGSDEEAEGE